MFLPYEYVLFKNNDPYELPIKYFRTLRDVVAWSGNKFNADTLKIRFHQQLKRHGNSIIRLCGRYNLERFKKENPHKNNCDGA